MLGFGLSLALPYLALFGVNAAHMTPVELGIFLTLNAVGAVSISTWLARRSDRLPNRKPLVLVTLLMGALAYVLLSVLRSYPALLLTGMVLLGTAAAAFPQVFALARAQLAGAGSSPEQNHLAERAVTVLRSVFSLSWVVGPGLGAVLLARWGFGGVFLGTALCFVLAALPLLALPAAPAPAGAKKVDARAGEGETPPVTTRVPLLWPAVAFVLCGMSMNMGSNMFPLLITHDLRGTEGQVGFLVGLCALLEIPCMFYLVLARRLPTTERLIKAALLLFTLHFVLVALSYGMPLLVVTQMVRAAIIAVMAGLGMLYFQELMPGRIAASTTLFANTGSIGSMLAGIVSGGAAQWFGYRSVFWLCALLTFVGWAVMQVLVKRGAGASGEGASGPPPRT